MLSGKFLFTLMGLLMAVFAISNLNLQQNSIEGFWMTGARKWKTMGTIKSKGCGTVASGGNFLGNLGDDQFIKRPQFQSMMAPRFNNSNVGAYIRHNPPKEDYMASMPCDPMLTGAMAQENYTNVQENYPTSSCGGGGCGGSSCGAASCGKGGRSVPKGGGNTVPSDFAAGDYNQVLSKAVSGSNQPEVVDSLPVGTMTNIDASGNVTNPVVYQNFIFANQQSRLRQYGDPIRGDLPIVPCEGNWFSVHPNVNLDLHEGAMNVMGGNAQQTSRATAQLISAAAGVTVPVGGVADPFEGLSMTPMYTSSLSGGTSDLIVSGMP